MKAAANRPILRNVKVAEILRVKGTNVLTTLPGATVRAAMSSMANGGVGALAVVREDGELVGLISERDVVVALARTGDEAFNELVSAVMAHRLITCGPDDRLTDLMAVMTNQRVRHVPVVERGRLAGIISIGDLVKARLNELEFESQILRDAYLRVR